MPSATDKPYFYAADWGDDTLAFALRQDSAAARLDVMALLRPFAMALVRKRMASEVEEPSDSELSGLMEALLRGIHIPLLQAEVLATLRAIIEVGGQNTHIQNILWVGVLEPMIEELDDPAPGCEVTYFAWYFSLLNDKATQWAVYNFYDDRPEDLKRDFERFMVRC